MIGAMRDEPELDCSVKARRVPSISSLNPLVPERPPALGGILMTSGATTVLKQPARIKRVWSAICVLPRAQRGKLIQTKSEALMKATLNRTISWSVPFSEFLHRPQLEFVLEIPATTGNSDASIGGDHGSCNFRSIHHQPS